MASTIQQLDKIRKLDFEGKTQFSDLPWDADRISLSNDNEKMRSMLLSHDLPLWAVRFDGTTFLTNQSGYGTGKAGNAVKAERLAYAAPLPLGNLGDVSFMKAYGTRYAYYSGAMANAISSVEMVIALGKAGLMGSYGSAGVHPDRIEEAIQAIQKALPDGPYAVKFNQQPQ